MFSCFRPKKTEEEKKVENAFEEELKKLGISNENNVIEYKDVSNEVKEKMKQLLENEMKDDDWIEDETINGLQFCGFHSESIKVIVDEKEHVRENMYFVSYLPIIVSLMKEKMRSKGKQRKFTVQFKSPETLCAYFIYE
jgi:hypothetical protein